MANFKIGEKPSHLHLEFFAPQAGNSLSVAAVRELTAIQKKYARWDRPVVVSSAHPTLFCSGGNLSEYKKIVGKAGGLKINREIQNGLRRFASWNVPKLALIEGDVFGGGMEWLAYFDFRWSTPNAVFAFWQRRIGLSSGWGGGSVWAKKIGIENVRRLLLEARLLSSDAALNLQLIDRVVSTWSIHDTAALWAAEISSLATSRLLDWTPQNEARTFSNLWMGPEHRAVLKKWRS